MNIYIQYLILIGLLGLLYYISYLYYKTKKWYYVWIFLLFLLITFFYYWYIFPFLFIWTWNFAILGLAILFWIVFVITIILSFFRNKIYIYFFISLFLFIAFINSIWNISTAINIHNGSIYTNLAKEIIDNSWSISNEKKEEFIKLSKKATDLGNYRYEITNNFYTDKAKKIIWMYNIEYCKKTNSDKCYLEFIKWKIWLKWYKNFSDKYNKIIEKYWKTIKKEIIFEWLKDDLFNEVNNNIKKQSIKTLEEIWIKHNNDINIWNIIWSAKFYDWKILIDWSTYNFFLKELYNNDKKEANKKLSSEVSDNISKKNKLINLDITNKRNLIKERISNLKKYYFKNLVYTEEFESTWKRSDWKNTFELYRSNINLKLNKKFSLDLNFDDRNALYIKYYADLEKYLNDDSYRKEYFENLRLLYYYFSWNDINPYISNVKIFNLWPDMKYSYDLNAKYSWNIINKQTIEDILKEKDDRFVNKKKKFIIKNDYNFNDLINNREYIDKIALKYNIIWNDDKNYLKKIIKEYYENKGFIFSDNFLEKDGLRTVFTWDRGYYFINKKFILKFPKNVIKDYIWFTYKKEWIWNFHIVDNK